MSDELMLPLKPYLLPTFYQWIVDSGKTPYLTVDATQPHVVVPEDYIDESGRIVLNLAPQAIRDLEITNRYLSFRATFGGKIVEIYTPLSAVESIHSMENGRGMMFEDEGDVLEPEDGGDSGSASTNKSSHMRAVD